MLFYLDSKKNKFHATLDYNNGTFILKKGSTVSEKVSTHFRSHKTVGLRREEAGITSDNLVLNKDIQFNSTTVAGEFVCGSSCNGPISWKTKEGITYKEWISTQR